MNWWEYAERVAQTDSPKAIATRTGIEGPNVSKWKSGTVPRPQIVAQFARGYGRPVLEAFVAAGFLTAGEAKERPAAPPDFTRLSNDELLELVRSRMGETDTGRSTATDVPPGPYDDDLDNQPHEADDPPPIGGLRSVPTAARRDDA